MVLTYHNGVCFEEKVSCEIREWPSMMWKKWIVQATAAVLTARSPYLARAAALVLVITIIIRAVPGAQAADLVIEIPASGAGADAAGARYRLDYFPPHGSPAPNFTVPARASTINFQGLPGTKYHFMLYYSNATFADLLTWNQTIVTAPEPPTNLNVTQGRNKKTIITWSPPAHGDYTGFRFKVIPLTEAREGARNITVEGGNGSYVVRDLAPGATYQLHAFTLLHDKESAAYASRNFTVRPNTPGKFIVWFRNETTLLVLWQPPYPPGAYTHYKVSIEPRDARDSELYVEKEGEPPGPAQAAFKGLVPGRAYNISVQTVSEPELSAPTTAQYRTVPLRPRNVTLDPRMLRERSFRVSWLPPADHRYQCLLCVLCILRSPSSRRPPRRSTAPCRCARATSRWTPGCCASAPSASPGCRPPTTGTSVYCVYCVYCGARARGAHHGAVPHRAAAPAQRHAGPPDAARALLPRLLAAARRPQVPVSTVCTVYTAEPELEAPTTAQYRTVPLRPRNVTLDPRMLRERSFRVSWLPPADHSEFEKYQVSVALAESGGSGGGSGGARRLAPVVRAREEPTSAAFEGLEPGVHYTVTVKTMSGKVTSWPAAADFTLKPLPVRSLRWREADEGEGQGHGSGGRGTGALLVSWEPADGSTQDEYKVSYYETDPSQEDSNTLTTPNTNVTLEGLLPGRNYTISVCAVSRGVESNESVVWAARRPLAPLLQGAPPAPPGPPALRLAWRAPPASRQAAFRLRYRRTDPPDDFRTLETSDTNATLEDLYPGTVYEIQIAAISHGLQSDWYTILEPVRPLPAQWLQVERATSNSVSVRWRGPASGALGGLALRYRTQHPASAWTSLPHLQPALTSAEITNMTHGERYTIELDTVSEAADQKTVTSGEPLTAEHTVRPNPVSNVEQLADTLNMTLEWPRPAGRVEWYELRWWPSGEEGEEGAEGGEGAEGEAMGARNISAGEDGSTRVRALLGGLRPGRGYHVSIAAHSYNLTSDLFTMHARTRPVIQSEMIVNESSRPESDDNETVSADLRVVYTRTPAAAAQFDAYRFRLEAAGEAPRTLQRPAAADSHAVDFRGLVPGRLYNLTMWTVSRNVTSHPVQRQARLCTYSLTHTHTHAHLRPRRSSTRTASGWRRRARRRARCSGPPRPTRTRSTSAASCPAASTTSPCGPSRATSPATPCSARRACVRTHSHTRTHTHTCGRGAVRRVPLPAGGGGRGAAHAAAGRRGRLARGRLPRPRARPPLQPHHVDRLAQRHQPPRAAPGAPVYVLTHTHAHTRTPAAAAQFDAYRFRLEAAGEAPRTLQRAAAADSHAVDFRGLVPGRLYNLTMWTVSRNVTSHPVQRQARLYPRPVSELRATEVGARHVALAWARPPGDFTDFEVQYLAAPDQLQAVRTDKLHLNLTALRPHRDYTFTVETRAGTPATILTRSRARSLAVRTREAAPGAPRNFAPRDARPSELTFAWHLPPDERNGVLRRYILTYAPRDHPDDVHTLEFPPDGRFQHW
ncbi:unnamed protein product [Parnassius mnemosyne]|uniref:Fibronectin type-III domain-containing protein n=1 Tax=Parnassius mnemosyne TaxID=213953 RepID=A0AAV1K8J8_9NEOP